MAVEFDVKGSRTSEYRFLPENIEVDPKMNGRYELPDIGWIIDSILRHGQLQPVTIRRTANKPVLVAGFSRWRAISKINKDRLTEKPLELRCCYTALTETADAGQDPQRSGLLEAHLGKGTYVYVAYALHRQLPELVPGSYRLLANLLSAGKGR